MASKVYRPLDKNKNKNRKKNIREKFSMRNPMRMGEDRTKQNTSKNNWETFIKWVIGDFITTLFITLVGTNMVFFTMLPSKYQDQLFPTDRDSCPYAKKGCGGCETSEGVDVSSTTLEGTEQSGGGEGITVVKLPSSSPHIFQDANMGLADQMGVTLTPSNDDISKEETTIMSGGNEETGDKGLVDLNMLSKKIKVLLADEVGGKITRSKDRTLLAARNEATDDIKGFIQNDPGIWKNPPGSDENSKGELTSKFISKEGVDVACENVLTAEHVKYEGNGDSSWSKLKEIVRNQQNENPDSRLSDLSGPAKNYLVDDLGILEETKLQNLDFKTWTQMESEQKDLLSQIEQLSVESDASLLKNYRFTVPPPIFTEDYDPKISPCEKRQELINREVLYNPTGKVWTDRLKEFNSKFIKPTGVATKEAISWATKIAIDTGDSVIGVFNKLFSTGLGKGMADAGEAAKDIAAGLKAKYENERKTIKDLNTDMGTSTAPVAALSGGGCPVGDANVEYECRDWASMFSKQNTEACRSINDYTEQWMCWDWPYKWIRPVKVSANSSKKGVGFANTIFSSERYNNKTLGDSCKTYMGCAFAEYWIFIRALFKWFLRLFKKGDGGSINPMAADIFPIIIGFFIIVPLVLCGSIHFMAYCYSGIKNLVNLFGDLGGWGVIKGRLSITWIPILLLVMTPLWFLVGNLYGIIISPFRIMFTLLFIPWLISSKMCKDIIRCNMSTFMMIFGLLVIKSAYLSLTKDSFIMMTGVYIILSLFNIFFNRTSKGKDANIAIKKIGADFTRPFKSIN